MIGRGSDWEYCDDGLLEYLYDVGGMGVTAYVVVYTPMRIELARFREPAVSLRPAPAAYLKSQAPKRVLVSCSCLKT